MSGMAFMVSFKYRSCAKITVRKEGRGNSPITLLRAALEWLEVNASACSIVVHNRDFGWAGPDPPESAPNNYIISIRYHSASSEYFESMGVLWCGMGGSWMSGHKYSTRYHNECFLRLLWTHGRGMGECRTLLTQNTEHLRAINDWPAQFVQIMALAAPSRVARLPHPLPLSHLYHMSLFHLQVDGNSFIHFHDFFWCLII